MIVLSVYFFVLMLMAAGIGIDLMRLERDRANLQATMDRAVLAAADLDQPLPPADVVAEYLSKAGLSSSVKSVQVDDRPGSRTVYVDSQAAMATQFMHMTGADSLRYTAASAARESIPNMEVSLVLDISESMADNSREYRMKEAAKDFVSSLLSDSSSSTSTSINVVPYAGHVNPGPEMFTYLEGVRFGRTDHDIFPTWAQDISNITMWWDVDGNGQIDPDIDYSAKIEGYPDNPVDLFNKDDLDEYYLFAVDYVERRVPELTNSEANVGATIKGGKQTTTFYSVDSGNSVSGSTQFKKTDMTIQFNDFYSEVIPNEWTSCLEIRQSDMSTTALPTSREQVGYFNNWDYTGDPMEWGWCPDNAYAIQYAQNDATALRDFIDSLSLFDGSGAAYGMKWAVSLLDPGSRPAFSYLSALGKLPHEFVGRPYDFNSGEAVKYVVIISDGVMTDQYRPTNKLDPVNATTELQRRDGSDWEIIETKAQVESFFQEQCNLAKENGIIVFTVAVDSPEIAAQLKQCASSDAHFFQTTSDGLPDTFASVGLSMQKLRLIQ